MIRFKWWRQLVAVLMAGVMAVFLVACGAPSKETAGDFVLKLMVAMYAGDIDPMLKSSDFSRYKNAQALMQARKAQEGKLRSVLVQNQIKIDKHGRVDRLKVDQVDFVNNSYLVKVQVTFDDGFKEYQNSRLRWSEELEQFVLMI